MAVAARNLVVSLGINRIVRPLPYTLVTGVLELTVPGVYAILLALAYLTKAVDGVAKGRVFSLRAGVYEFPYRQFP